MAATGDVVIVFSRVAEQRSGRMDAGDNDLGREVSLSAVCAYIQQAHVRAAVVVEFGRSQVAVWIKAAKWLICAQQAGHIESEPHSLTCHLDVVDMAGRPDRCAPGVREPGNVEDYPVPN